MAVYLFQPELLLGEPAILWPIRDRTEKFVRILLHPWDRASPGESALWIWIISMLDGVKTGYARVMLAIVLLASLLQPANAQDDDTPDASAAPGKIVVPLSGTAIVTRVGDLVVTPATLDTGLVEIGENMSQRVTVNHTGSDDADPVVITGATLFGKSASEYHSDFVGQVTLLPGDSIDIDVLFTPTVPGTKSAGLRMDINGATAPYIVLFNGWSRFPLTSELASSDDVFDLGQVVEGGTKTKTFTLINQGEEEAPVINISALQLSGDQAEDFTTDFAPVQLAPGEQADVKVTLSATFEGFKSANVEILHDGFNPTVEMLVQGEVVKPAAIPVNFGKSTLKNATLAKGTSLQFGPDDLLYASEVSGAIHVFEVTRSGKNNYTADKLETINLVKNVTNHNDDGSVNNGQKNRQITGIHVVGTATNPVIYVASSDPRIGAGPSGTDKNLDTNSGILHKLTKNGGSWSKQDLVRGLPRSEENHGPNGLWLDGDKLLLLSGGHTNQGVPSKNFALTPEYALSAWMMKTERVRTITTIHSVVTMARIKQSW